MHIRPPPQRDCQVHSFSSTFRVLRSTALAQTSLISGYTDLRAANSRDNLKGKQGDQVVEILGGKWRPNYLALIIKLDDGRIISTSSMTVDLEAEVRAKLDQLLTPDVKPLVRSTEARQHRAY